MRLATISAEHVRRAGSAKHRLSYAINMRWKSFNGLSGNGRMCIGPTKPTFTTTAGLLNGLYEIVKKETVLIVRKRGGRQQLRSGTFSQWLPIIIRGYWCFTSSERGGKCYIRGIY